MSRLRRFAASAGQALLVLLAVPAAASAQPYLGSAGPHRGTLEIGGGVVWTRGYDAGGADATETRPGSTTPLTLFSVSSQMLNATGAGAALGVYLAPRVSIEAMFQYSRPILRAHISNDFEAAPDTDADGVVTTYLAGGSVLYHFGAGRFVPFVSGGGGYLRQLHEENNELLTGAEIHAGGGVKYWMGTGKHRFGIRVDAQASARSKSVAFEQKRRILPSLAAGLIYTF